jgi:hypothetical protein
LERLRIGIYTSLVLIVLGLVLLAVPFDETQKREVTTEEVWIDWGTGTGTNIDLRRGDYEIWIADRTPGVLDYEHFGFSIHSLDDELDVILSESPETMDLNGDPHEVYCSFRVPRSDMYFYDTWMAQNWSAMEDQFDIVFMRGETLADQPTFGVGITLIIIGSVALPVLFVMMRDRKKGSMVDGRLYP